MLHSYKKDLRLLVRGKADDLYRGSMQFVNHRRTALHYPLVHWTYAAANNTALLA